MEVNIKLSIEDPSPLVDTKRYKSLIGSLVYLCNTRLDINYVVGILSILQISHEKFYGRNGIISWTSKKQPTVLLSSKEVEYNCIAISKNPMFHARTKHIEIQYHYIRELIEDEVVEMDYIAQQKIIMQISLPKHWVVPTSRSIGMLLKVLCSLLESWHTKSTTIEEAKDLSKVTLDELVGSLMTYEIKKKNAAADIEKPKKTTTWL
ncbi:uncharacterized protein LOC131145842 [Malania oleifera]|uniref:uncharacterized protein LOC131145842 n=1 Tax=Malania oleifera TaxID=397392 RepID=UPI0025AE8BD9|nr:uncharacterized protein LOC131145842 [Malania oleifera]